MRSLNPSRAARATALSMSGCSISIPWTLAAQWCDQDNVDATDAATLIEHRLAGDVDAVERHGDLVGTAGRQEVFAPDQLKGLDKFVGVFVFVFLVVGHGDSSLIDRVFGKIVPSIHGHENGAPTNITD